MRLFSSSSRSSEFLANQLANLVEDASGGVLGLHSFDHHATSEVVNVLVVELLKDRLETVNLFLDLVFGH